MKKMFLLALVVTASVSAMQPTVEVAKRFIKTVARETGAAGGIIGGAVVTACLYGIANDQVTARICPEYFSEGFHKKMRDSWHGPILGAAKAILEKTKSPTVVATIWGPLATWWVGLGLGIPAVLAARLGPAQQLGVQDLVRPLAATAGITGAGALMAGAYGYLCAAADPAVRNSIKWAAGNTPANALTGFITCAYAHNAAYSVGALAGLGLTGYIVNKRLQAAPNDQKQNTQN
jgi:hypothetical protein